MLCACGQSVSSHAWKAVPAAAADDAAQAGNKATKTAAASLRDRTILRSPFPRVVATNLLGPAFMKSCKNAEGMEPMLQVPLEIAFHNIDSSAWAEQEIRARVADLERIYDRLTSCRVRIDQRAKDLTGTIPPVVRIELGIPGRSDLVVSHEPDHLLRKYQHPDLHKAINEAFRIAERQLLDLKEQRDDRAQGAAHDSENQSLGQIAEITPEQDFGFLLTKEGGLLYFHRNAVLSGDFDDLERGDEVYYVEDLGDTGPIAAKVRVKAKSTASPR
jgi:ribosome-associated translation inhibitor RaiA